MLTHKFRTLLEEYQRKQWFPGKYPEPLGDLMDYLNQESITGFLDLWRKTGNHCAFSISHFLHSMLPALRYPELLSEYRQLYERPIFEQGVYAADVFYHIRRLSEEQAKQLWNDLQEWLDSNRSVFHNWLQVQLDFENGSREFRTAYLQSFGIDAAEIEAVGESLRATAELFDWKCSQRMHSSRFDDWIRYLNLGWAIDLADWNDFGAFAAAVAETAGLGKLPRLKRNQEKASIQFLFPIEPPKRVLQEFGTAAGPFDLARFLFHFGKGCFYSGMNPDLPVEERILGDPSLPSFWGSLFYLVVSEQSLLEKIVSKQSGILANDFRFVLEFSFRHDAALAIYRNRALTDFSNAESIYSSSFDVAFGRIQPAAFLYLLEMERASDSLTQEIGLRSAFAACERLKILYGKDWFYSPRFAARCRDYWWEGFRLTRKQVLDDLQVPDPLPYPF